ncbi:MAG: tetratricopeptide repeat protein [Oligoflexus sp.]
MQLTRNKAQKSKAIAKPQADHDNIKISIAHLFIFLTLLGIVFYSQQLMGSDQEKLQESMRQLENKIWMVDPAELSNLEKNVTRLIQEEPFSPFAHYLLGHLYLRQFKSDPADMAKLRKSSELAQQAIDLNEDSEYGYLVSAAILDMMGYSDNAAKMIDPAINTKIKESWRTLFVRAQLMAGRDSVDLVLETVATAIEREPSARQLIAPYVVALIRSEYEGSEIIKKLKSWNHDFPDEIFMQGLAVAYVDEGSYKDAVKVYKDMTKIYPNNLDAQINQGILAYFHLNEYQKGRRLLEKSLEHQALLTDVEKRSLVESHLGRIYLKQGLVDQARGLFRKAISQSSDSFEWLSFSQQSYKQEQQFTEFATLLNELKDDIPGSGLLYALHGEVMSEYLDQHEQAVNAYHNAILLEPEKIEYHNGLGLAYYRQRDMSRALATFSRAIKLDPRDATIRYNEACILSLLGRTHEALGSLREALSLDPRLIQTAKNDDDFENIRSLKQFEDLVEPLPSQLTQLP